MRAPLMAFLLVMAAAFAQKPTVVVTIEPYRFLLQELVGDRMQVSVLVPPSFNPHVYEPTPSQVKEVAQARLVVANGAGLDKWVVDKLVRPNNLSVPVFQVADAVRAYLIATPAGPDPHIWVDPVLMARVVPPLAEALTKADPAGKALYQVKAQRLEKALQDLDKEVANYLKVRSKAGVIALRNPFRYFTQRYQIPILYVVVPNPEAPDASAKAVAEARRLAQEKGVRHLLAPLPAKTQAEPLARNMGLEVVLVDALGEKAASYRDLILNMAQAFAQALR
ncbi:metal ABC transporter substrate-binding protein [Thermus albus]|uniref:metal ABC transporter substrate-binding protein n=1 Tax=Thermus albus TaxID=2908146 RepID=UPI001FAA4ABC|nr:metal ABC transporter substrate-binding protein [Thermus albus]